MKKVSFDFDDTLDRGDVQTYAQQLLNEGVEVWIVTAREDLPIDNRDLFSVSDRLGIPRNHIVFVSYRLKAEYFKNHPDFIWHLDNDFNELEHMEKAFVNTIGISVYSPLYKEVGTHFLNKYHD